MQEYFEPKIGRKIKMFSLDRKVTFLQKSACYEDSTLLVKSKKMRATLKKLQKEKKVK